MRKIALIVVIILLAASIVGCAKTPFQDAPSTTAPSEDSAAWSQSATPAEIADPLEQWIGDYMFYEFNPPDQNRSYELSIYKKDDVYLARFDIYGFQTMNAFIASVTGNAASVDFTFEKYEGDNLFEPYNKGDLLLTLKKDKDALLTFWGEIGPMIIDNVSGKVYFQKVVEPQESNDTNAAVASPSP